MDGNESLTSAGAPPNMRLSGSLSVAIVTAVIGATVPATTALHGYFAKQRELALAEMEQQYKALDRAVDSKLQPADRQLVLRFLASVSEDARLQGWATRELRDVEKELQDARDMIARLEVTIKENAEKAADAIKQLEEAEQELRRLRTSKAARNQSALEQEMKVEKLSVQVRAAQAAQERTRETLSALRADLKPSTGVLATDFPAPVATHSDDFNPKLVCQNGGGTAPTRRAQVVKECQRIVPRSVVKHSAISGSYVWAGTDGDVCICNEQEF